MISIKKVLSALAEKKQDKPVLLWENPNPTASFGTQTISLDLSNYSKVEIHYYHDILATLRVFVQEVSVGYRGAIFQVGGAYIRNRDADASVAGVAFGKGTSNQGDSNTYCVPVKIYGIK